MSYIVDSKRSQGEGGTTPLPKSKPLQPHRTKAELLTYIRARLSAPDEKSAPDKGAMRLCVQIKADGTACSSPALRGHAYCYFHQDWRDSHTTLDERIRRLERRKSRLDDAITRLRELQKTQGNGV